MNPPDQLDGQILPAAVHLERALLGSMLLYPAAVAEGLSSIDAADFYLDSHQRIFRAIRSLASAQSHIDFQTVSEHLKQVRELDSVGGLGYIINLENDVSRNPDAREYARTIKDRSRQRAVLALHHDAYQAAYDPAQNTQEFIERSIADLRELAEESGDNYIQSVGDFLAAQGEPEAILDTLTTAGGLKLGFAGLDEMLGGLVPGDLVIVAARPSMGKTAWACNVAQSLALRGHVTAFYSLEQKRTAMIRRMLASAARVDYREIKDGTVRSEDRRLLMERREMLASAPLYIEDRPGLTVSRIDSQLQRLKRHRGLEIALIDQLSKVSRADCKQRDFRLQIGEQTGALKRMAQELGIPVVVFNQLSRDTGKRSDPTPQLTDLKESGSIEEDADIAIFLHRPEYFDKADESLRGKGQMLLAKNREGQTGTVDCTYQGRIMRWDDNTQPAAEQRGFDQGWR